MAETWTYEIWFEKNPNNFQKNQSRQAKIKRTYPSNTVDTTQYKLSSTSGTLSSNKCAVVYQDPSNVQLRLGDYGTTSTLTNNTVAHALQNISVTGISQSIVSNVGTFSSSVDIMATCSNNISTNLITLSGTYNSTGIAKLTLSVSVEQVAQSSSATVPQIVYFGGLIDVSFSSAVSASTTKVLMYPSSYPTQAIELTISGLHAIGTVPSSWTAYAGTSSYLVGVVKVATYSGGVETSSKTYYTTISFSSGGGGGGGTSVSSPPPEIKSITIEVINDQTLNNYAQTNGKYIQGMTGIKLTVDAEGKSDATIKSYSFSASAGSYIRENNTYYTDVLQVSGAIKFTINVVDSRGMTASESRTIDVIKYNKPTISNVSAIRCDENGTPSETGLYAKVKASASYTPIDIDSVSVNSVTLSCKYSRLSVEESVYHDMIDSMINNREYIHNGNFNSLYQYQIRFYATDSIGGVSYVDANMSTAPYAIHVRNGGLGVAFGKTSEEDAVFDITDSWTPKWGQYTMPRVVCQRTQPQGKPGLIWLEPKN